MPAPAEYEVRQQTISHQQTDQNSVELTTFFKCHHHQLSSHHQISLLPDEVSQGPERQADLGDHSQCSAVQWEEVADKISILTDIVFISTCDQSTRSQGG